MAAPIDCGRVRAILLDIEGTTTPVEFVYRVLFPYARGRVRSFLQQHLGADDVRADIASLRNEHAADVTRNQDLPAWRDDSAASEAESAVAYIDWLMDRDRKSTGLKSLQGKIWETGYRRGELRSQVFADVPPAFTRWRAQQKDVCIFSSGSVLAQRLLFAHTTDGDLTPFIRAYFDTTTGAKAETVSYRRIARALKLSPSAILFVSDVASELDAAQRAGMQGTLCVRAEEPARTVVSVPVIHTFDEVCP